MGYDEGLDSFDDGLDSGSDSGGLDSFSDSSMDSPDSSSLDNFGDSSLDGLDSVSDSSLDSIENLDNSSLDIVDNTSEVPMVDSVDALEVNNEQTFDGLGDGNTLDVVPNDISDELDTLDAIENNPIETVETEATENLNFFENNEAINLEKEDISEVTPETSGEMLNENNPYQEQWEDFYEEMNGETIDESSEKWDSLSEVPFSGDDNQLEISDNTDNIEESTEEGPQKVLKLTPTGGDFGYQEKTFLEESQEEFDQIVSDENISNTEKIDQLNDLKDNLETAQEQELEDSYNEVESAEEVLDSSGIQEYQDSFDQVVEDESLSNEEKIDQLNDLKDNLEIAQEQELDNSYNDIDDTEAIESPSEIQEYQDESFEETYETEEPNENIEDVSSWLNEVNPNFDEFDVDSPYSNNCGSCAFAVYNRLEGNDTDICATAENIPTNEAMEAATGLEMQQSTPADIEKMLLDQGDGAHAIIGVDRAEGPGHWFNAAVIDGKVYAIDGQSGQMYDWPPDYGDVVHWDVSVKKEM